MVEEILDFSLLVDDQSDLEWCSGRSEGVLRVRVLKRDAHV